MLESNPEPLGGNLVPKLPTVIKVWYTCPWSSLTIIHVSQSRKHRERSLGPNADRVGSVQIVYWDSELTGLKQAWVISKASVQMANKNSQGASQNPQIHDLSKSKHKEKNQTTWGTHEGKKATRNTRWADKGKHAYLNTQGGKKQ